MPGRKLRFLGTAVSLALLLVLSAQAAEAATRARVAAPVRQAGALEWAWSWLTGWFGGQGGQGLARLWAEQGLGMDPDGRPAAVTGDAGYGLDPDGRPAAVSGDASFGIDPNG